ncbi:MAG TPA: DUF6518 family protein [Micromonosporaceae bacterium]|jgi:hypothetical protein
MLRWSLAAVIGLAVGILTSYGQAVLDSPWSALVNSASPWLAGAFVAGALQPRVRRAALGGLVACVLEVVGYYVTTVAGGYPVSTTEIIFWTACALVGGPLFGAAGYWWWSQRRGIGAALLPAAFLAEAIGLYWAVLHYRSTAYLYAIVALVLAALLSVRVTPPLRVAGWLLGLAVLGIAGEYVLGQVGNVAFG